MFARFTRPARLALASVSALTLALPLAACAHDSSDQAGSTAKDGAGALSVATSFYPVQYLVEAVGGDHVAATSVTPVGSEPHDYELSPADVTTLGQASLVVYVSGFQASLDDALTQVSGPEVVDLADAVELVHHEGIEEHDHDHGSEASGASDTASEEAHEHAEEEATADEHAEEHSEEHSEEAADPHFWLDPQRMIKAAQAVSTALSAADPDHAADYEANLATLTTTLTDLDESYTTGLAQCERTTFVTAHSAFGYLADRYHLTQASVSGVDPEAEPSPAELAEVKEIVESTGTTTIFTEELVSPKTAEALAAETGASTDVLNPIESQPEGGDYAQAMSDNLTALRQALGCQ